MFPFKDWLVGLMEDLMEPETEKRRAKVPVEARTRSSYSDHKEQDVRARRRERREHDGWFDD